MARPPHTKLAAQRARELRNDMTMFEARLWTEIRAGKLGVRFRRQVPMGHWIVDFACLDPKIVIELDDRSHDFRDERRRTAFIESIGFLILRFDNIEVARELDLVLQAIEINVVRLSSPGGGGGNGNEQRSHGLRGRSIE